MDTRRPLGYYSGEPAERIVELWEEMTLGMMRHKLMTWEKLIGFYADNQALINSTYMPLSDFRMLHECMRQEYSAESSIVAIATFSFYHWCFGYSYRTKRLAAEEARKMEKEKKLAEIEAQAAAPLSRRDRFLASGSPLLEPSPIHCMKCGAFLGMSEEGALVSAECEQCEQPPLALQSSNLASIKRLAQGVASLLMERFCREKR